MSTNDLVILLGTITFFLILWNLLISVRIVNELKKRHIKARIAHRRGLIFKYVRQYKDITLAEDGSIGPLYRPFILSFILFSIGLLTGIIISTL